MARPLQVLGFDPSLRNWGMARGQLLDGQLTVQHLSVVCPELPTGKLVRQNSLDLEASTQLADAALKASRAVDALFVEVPVGSQSARAMASYAICVGVLGSLRAHGIPFFEVTATEVKLAAGQKKTATKAEMIAWAMAKHPEANWPMVKEHGELRVSAAKAEHMADAIGAIYAGLNLTSFKQLLQLAQDRANPFLAPPRAQVLSLPH